MKKIILISKDTLDKHALIVYDNKYYKTPNINELAGECTVFNYHYLMRTSNTMEFTNSMLGNYCLKKY